ncbi:TonB-dependent receptor [Granulicella sp. S156]|jgi:Carboxypeptidase regulatory-like domain|uniref:TonB-dependent receptor n=1 Tax=Granulicella sp. S156 TaxID=1747224 RepID=UPI00131C485C|nr:TonB-dependent receptor [Granulicella sp. S156]
MIEKTQHKQHRTGQCENLFRQAGRLIVLMALLIGSATFGSRAALAQLTTADILGTVTDSTGAVVPKANVTLVNVDTNLQRTTVSNDSGDYEFTLLPVGHYSVTVKISGFKTSTTSNLSVEAGDRAHADVHLETGGATETVTVEAQTPLLQADNATISSTVTAKAVQDLPLNGRNFVQLVDLVPGANEGAGNSLSSGGRPDDRRTNAAGLSINGQDESLNNWVVDGVDDNERIIGTIGVKPNVEGIQEITIQTNSYAPEAGRTAGGVINIVTKSGTNQFHGSAYEYFRNDIFDGRSVLQTTGNKPELRQNQYGGSVGGPILRNKAFFYFDYEGFRQVSGVTDTGTVPTLAEYNDINSVGGSIPQDLLSAANGTAGLPINTIALNYLKLFPAPTNTSPSALSNNYTISPNKTQNSNTYDARVDDKINDRNLLFARFAYNSVDTFTPPNFGTVNGLQISGGRYNFDGPATDIAQQYLLGYTHIFTSSLLIDLRAAFTRINNLSLPLNYGKNADQTVGFPASMTAFSPFANSLTPISVGPFGDIGDGAYVPLQDIDNTFQYSGTLSWTKGNHSIKVGATFLRRQARNVQSASAVGAYQFNLPSDTNSDQLTQQSNQLASTLVGAFTSQTRNFNLNPPDYRSYEPGGFAQDSWRATPKLTAVFGVRYDVFTPFTEAHNHISNFDFPDALTLGAGNVSSALKIAGVNGVNSQVDIPTDHSNVAPRVGFAYSMTPSIVVRGGYGLSFFPGNYTSNADLKNAPFTSVYSPSCQSTIAVQIETAQNALAGQNPDCATQGQPGTLNEGLPSPVPPTAAQIANLSTLPGLGFVAEAPKFKSALIQQFNLQVEQQFGSNVFTIGYVGNIGQHLPESINNINQPKPFNVLTDPAGANRPLFAQLPNLGGVSYIQSEGVSNYNGLQTSFQRRFTHGLAFDANYTWSKALADISSFSQQGDQGWSNADPTRIRQIEYGKSDTDIQNRFALSLNYELQYGKEFTGIKKAVFTGWQTNMIMVWQSGKPFSIVESGAGADDPDTDCDLQGVCKARGFNNRAVPQNSGGADRPNQIADSRLSHKTLTEFFNTAAFAPQALGTVGSTQRNSQFGPDFRHVDLSLFKNFPVTHSVNVQFRVESFNVSNTPNFFIANNNSSNQSFGNAAFGTVTATDPNYVPREIQFALKLQF